MIITAKAPSLANTICSPRVKPLERFFHGMLRLRSSRQMLRQAIITSKTANAIAVANTAMIVANERTYITPYANVRNTLFPWTEKAPAVDGRGKLAERGEKLEFSPIRSAS